MCTLLIGQINSDQSEPCRSDLKTTWRQHHDSGARQRCTVNECKTVQVASNGVTMLGISYASLVVDYRFQGADTPGKSGQVV